MTHPPHTVAAGQGRDEEELINALRASRVLHNAPEAVLQRALDLWDRAPMKTRPDAGLPARWRKLVASLVFDSAALSPLAAGLRGAVGQAPRQLLYTAEGCDVDLRFTCAADGQRWVLSGQVLGPDLSGHATLQPASADESVQERPWNELAEFHFEPMAAGPCTLVLRSADWMLELPLQLPPAVTGVTLTNP